MADPMHGVVMAAADLKSVAPNEYDRFIISLAALEDRCWEDLAAAEKDVIFSAQGRVQLIVQLKKKLEDCHLLRSQYETRK